MPKKIRQIFYFLGKFFWLRMFTFVKCIIIKYNNAVLKNYNNDSSCDTKITISLTTTEIDVLSV